MRPEPPRLTVAADDVGIHFLAGDKDVVIDWGEIAQICALRDNDADGTPFVEVFVDHFCGVDFRLKSVAPGYEQTTAEMEKRLIGFRRAALEAIGTVEDERQTIPVVWRRDEAIQPFRLRPRVIDACGPTPQERAQMGA